MPVYIIGGLQGKRLVYHRRVITSHLITLSNVLHFEKSLLKEIERNINKYKDSIDNQIYVS